MSHPLVVNKHRTRRYDVYVGRPTKWGNPFQVDVHGTRDEVVDRYRVWVQGRPELMTALPELRGKVLGCFCAPARCHADVLAELANGGGADNTMSLFGGDL